MTYGKFEILYQNILESYNKPTRIVKTIKVGDNQYKIDREMPDGSIMRSPETYDSDMLSRVLKTSEDILKNYEDNLENQRMEEEEKSSPDYEEPEEDFETVGLSGEYWFDDNGTTMYADANVSDMNHEAYVVQKCASEVLSYFDMGYEDDPNLEQNEDAILQYIVDNGDYEDDEDQYEALKLMKHDPADAMIDYLKKQGVENANDLVMHGYGCTNDSREYAIKNWGWSRVAGDSIETKELTRDTLKTIARGISNALEEEGKIYEYESNPEILDQHQYTISTYSGNRYDITLKDMESGNVQGLERSDLEVKATAATQQVRQMDIDSMPSYYRNKGVIGDSYILHYMKELD